jgi:hypothetical protein
VALSLSQDSLCGEGPDPLKFSYPSQSTLGYHNSDFSSTNLHILALRS